MKPLLVSSGEPAGIGPDICLATASLDIPIVVLGDPAVLAQRAEQLGLRIQLKNYKAHSTITPHQDTLNVLPIPSVVKVTAGQLDYRQAPYVIEMLKQGVDRCLTGEFSAFVTAPVHKGIMNQGGFKFTGHTEFLADRCQSPHVVMMLACKALRVALVTTHIPLRMVAEHINQQQVIDTLVCLEQSLKKDFGITRPQIFVAGLNPHAGESGYLGNEEIEVIEPALNKLKNQGMAVYGPLPADTLFVPKYLKKADAFVVMYHDQGLPVIKYAGFGEVVNITLGLPIIRTSVDHGTAIELAGSGLAQANSLIAAIEMAQFMVQSKEKAHVSN